MSSKDKSPIIPTIGPISESVLLKRRYNSREALNDTYYHYDSYDNVTLFPEDEKDIHKHQVIIHPSRYNVFIW